MPFSLGLGPAVLEVENELGKSDPMLVDIERASPGLFGVVDADGQPISEKNPALPGERLILRATGLGRLAIDPTAVALGVSAATRPPVILLNGHRIKPLSVRPLGNISGLYEIGFNLPALSTALSLEVSLLAEGRRSNTIRLDLHRPEPPPDSSTEPDQPGDRPDLGPPRSPSDPVRPDDLGNTAPNAPDTPVSAVKEEDSSFQQLRPPS